MLSAPNRVTAIFCHDDDEAELIHHLASGMGLKFPGDLSLIGFGDASERYGVFRSRLTSVTINEFDLGARAVLVLKEIRDGQRRADSDEVFYEPLTLVQGETLGAAPKEHASM